MEKLLNILAKIPCYLDENMLAIKQISQIANYVLFILENKNTIREIKVFKLSL